MSPGLKRAREPFRMRNALTGLALGLAAFGIYSYSISAVKQDVFDDIDEEAKALARAGTSSGTASFPSPSSSSSSDDQPSLSSGASSVTSKPPPIALSLDDEKKIMENAIEVATGVGAMGGTPQSEQVKPLPSAEPVRGVLQGLGRKYPWLLDPKSKTLVWGAPPVDDIGKMGSKRS